MIYELNTYSLWVWLWVTLLVWLLLCLRTAQASDRVICSVQVLINRMDTHTTAFTVCYQRQLCCFFFTQCQRFMLEYSCVPLKDAKASFSIIWGLLPTMTCCPMFDRDWSSGQRAASQSNSSQRDQGKWDRENWAWIRRSFWYGYLYIKQTQWPKLTVCRFYRDGWWPRGMSLLKVHA